MQKQNSDETAQRWMAAWRSAGPELERIRREEIRHADTPAAIESLQGAFLMAVRDCGLRPGSGLVEQQRWFRRMRR